MAQRVNKLCPGCHTIFYGSDSAKTCSARCRKRLQRAKAALVNEAETLKDNAEELAHKIEVRVEPPYASEGGYVDLGTKRAEPEVSRQTMQNDGPKEDELSGLHPWSSPPASERPISTVASTGTTAAFNNFMNMPREETPVSPPEPQPQPAGQSPAVVHHHHHYAQGQHDRRRVAVIATAVIVFAGALFLLTNRTINQTALNQQQQSQAIQHLAQSLGESPIKTQPDATKIDFNVDTVVSNGKKLTATGQVAIQNEADSTHAFTVQNASGNNLLIADTTNGVVKIGGAAAGATALQVSGDISATGTITSKGTVLSSGGLSANNGSTTLNNSGLTINNVLVCTVGGCKSSTSPSANSIDASTVGFLAKNQTFSGINSFTSAGNTFTGDGSGLSAVNAAQLNGHPDSYYSNAGNLVGSLADARLSANVTLQGNNFNGIRQLVRLDSSGNLPALNASLLTNLNASAITIGTVSDARLSSNVTLAGNSFNGSSELVQTNASGDLPALSGINLTNLDASNVAAGTLNDLRLSPNVTLQGDTFNGASQLVQTTALSYLPALNGSLVTNLNASNLTSGTLGDGRLSNNVALLGAASQTFSGNNTFSNVISAPGLETTSSSHTIAVGFSGTASGDITYNFDNTASPGTYTICTSSGNCNSLGGAVTATGATVGQLAKFDGSQDLTSSIIGDDGITASVAGDLAVSGNITQNSNAVCDVSGNCAGLGGQVGGSGTSGHIALFNGTSTIGDSILTQAATTIGVAGSLNVTGTYQLNGSQISSAALSNDSNLAKLDADQTFSGANIFQNATDSATAFQIQNAAGTSNLFIADTTNTRIGIGVQPGYTLDVNGDINIATGSSFRINGVAICGPSTTCAPSAGSNNYIQNGVTLQANANFNIQSVNSGSVVGILRGASGQTADLLRAQDGTGANVFTVGTNGDTNISGVYKIGGTTVCSVSGCNAATGSGNYIQNGTAQQVGANFNIDGNGTIGGKFLAKNASDSATAFQVQNANGIGLIVADTLDSRVSIGPVNSLDSTLEIRGAASSSTQVRLDRADTGATVTRITSDSNGTKLENLTGTLNIVSNSTKVQDAADNTSIFSVQNSSDSNLFNVDSQNNVISLLGNNSGQLGSWATAANSLPAALQGGGAVMANGYVYFIGGCDNSCTAQSTVYYAKLNTDGSTGTWQTNVNPLPGARRDASTVAANGYVYEIGGLYCSGASICSTVYYAKLNTDGSTGTWTTNSNPLPVALNGAPAVVANGYIYVMGGGISGGRSAAVYYAKLNADGSTGAWQTNVNALPQALDSASSVAANGYVYVMGGHSSSAFLSTVYYAKLNADGSTGAWQTSSNSLPILVDRATSSVANGYIYVIGGSESGVGSISTVYYAKLNTDGSTGVWQTNTNALPGVRSFAASILANGYLYEIGGDASNNGSSPQSTVYYASTSRVQIGANLDLVGLQGGTLADGDSQFSGSTGGSITAGNGVFVGSLQVQGAVSLAQGASIGGNLTANGSVLFQNSANSAVAFQVENAAGTSLLTADTSAMTITINGALNVAGNLTISSGTLITSSSSMYGTSLPASPVNGQEYYYEADPSNGVIWHLRYDSSAGYWNFLGGSPLRVTVNTNEGYPNQAGGVWANLATNGPLVSVPLAGDYEAWGYATQSIGYSGGDTLIVSIEAGDVSGSAPFAEFDHDGSTGSQFATIPYKFFSGLSAGTNIKFRYFSSRGNSASPLPSWSTRQLYIQPVRVN